MAKVPMLRRGWLDVSRINVTSPMGLRRGKPHRGIDIDTSNSGNKIYAPFDGTLTCRWNANGYGLYLTLNGSGVYSGVQLRFGHLHSTILGNSNSSNGSRKTVSAGEYIGTTGGWRGDGGRQGRSTGSHLHFEYRYDKNHHWSNGTEINPILVISDPTYGKKNGVSYLHSTLASTKVTINSGSIVRHVGNNQSVTKPDDLEIGDNSNANDYFTINIDENAALAEVDEETDWNKTEQEPQPETEKSEGLALGIWQIIKLAMDSEVTTLHVLDTSLSYQTGPLIGFFNKMCQQPLVEFSGDTYGDQYYFTVRRPPFDKENMLKTLTELGLADTGDGVDESYYDNPYVIKSQDIIDTNISFNNANIYSWYQYFPVYEGADGDDLQYMVPAVFFPEYAAIWGSRDLTIRSQYRDFRDSDFFDKARNGEKSKHGDMASAGILRDLHYLIESNAYNPFTRSGTVTLLGNRKIKRGTFIEIDVGDGVAEIYYVENVNQNYSISGNQVNRTTTLSLSHGMVKRFIFNGIDIDIKGEGKNEESYKIKSTAANYFNLINFGDWKSQDTILRMDNWRHLLSSWKVNTEVFSFFLRKIQFLI